MLRHLVVTIPARVLFPLIFIQSNSESRAVRLLTVFWLSFAVTGISKSSVIFSLWEHPSSDCGDISQTVVSQTHAVVSDKLW